MRLPASTWRFAALAAGLLALPAGVRAEGFSLYLEPSLSVSSVDTRDQLGNTSHLELRSLSQLYRIGFDRPIGPALNFSTAAQLEQKDAQIDTGIGPVQSIDGTRRSFYARLMLDLPALNGGVNLDLGDQSTSRSVRLVNDSLAGFLNWRPLDLPEVSLRVSRTHFYDAAHTYQDVTTDGAQLAVRYPVGPLELKYLLQWTQPRDALTGTETSSINQVAQATYGDRFFDGRTVAYASLTLHNQQTTTLVAGTGTISTQQHPVAGLSLVELFPVLPGTATLVPNPALIDGDFAAGAAVDLGYAISLGGDQNHRDLGVQFADVLTSVNQLQVWVDKKLPVDVSSAFAWSAWQSDDNRTWTPIPITGPVVFGAFQNRFEIPIPETRARYLKVVTQPLLGGVTTDPLYASILVTELQVFLVTSAASAPRQTATSGAQLTASASTMLWRAAQLEWDVMATLERRISPNVTLWSVLNGLSGSQRVVSKLQLNERVTRLDGDYGIGHVGQTDWSVGLVWTPVVTFLGSIVYTGQYVDSQPTLDVATGTYYEAPGAITNTVSALARANLYPGISTQLTGSVGQVVTPDGKNTWNETLNAMALLAPNPWVNLRLGLFAGWSTVYWWDAPPVSTPSLRADAGATFRPTDAISATATVVRILAGATPTTSGTFQLNYSPFRGDLQLSAAYSRTYDTASQSTLELFTPGVRWTVRPGVLLTATYTLLDNSSPISVTNSRTFNLVLNISL